MLINISHIEASSHVDGPGERTVLFAQGCPIRCPGCQNTKLWPLEGGHLTDTADLALTVAQLAARHGNVTISGGEPFAQPQALAYLVRSLRAGGVKHIIVYTGRTMEELCEPTNGLYLWLSEIMTRIDVLVDGPFIASQDHDLINYRGSRNQRPIDMTESLKRGELVLLDWERPQITVTAEGDLVMPIGLAGQLAGVGQVGASRRCGETGR